MPHRLVTSVMMMGAMTAWTGRLDAQEAATPAPLGRVLMLTHSAGYRHGVVTRPSPEALSPAAQALTDAAADRFTIDATQDCGAITADNLARYDAVVFYTTGDLPIPDQGRRALIDYVKGGGGFVGIHSATDTLYDFAPYGEMIGGYFDGHPWHEKVTVNVEAPLHPATAHLGESFTITDEIYQFRNFSRDGLKVLLSLDNESVDVSKGKRADEDYAVAWAKPFGAGRVFYTSLGHREEVWRDPRFLKHLMGGLTWATGNVGVGAKPAESSEEARMLFNGEDLDSWQHPDGSPARWKLVDDGAMQADGGSLVTKDRFKDHRIHVEFWCPDTPDDVHGQGRGNSGVYVQGRYEVQVLDSYGVDPLKMGDCGSIYGIKVADVNVCPPPETWQAYDIFFTAARYDEQGHKTADARVTVYQNGVLIHDDVALPHTTGGHMLDEGPEPGPLYLQDHGNPVRFRNVWVVPQ